MPVFPALWRATVGEMLEARNWRSAWATYQDPISNKNKIQKNPHTKHMMLRKEKE